METTIRWTFLFASMALVFWIRTLPLSLPFTDEMAKESVWQTVRERVAEDVSQTLSPAEWRNQVNNKAHQWIEQNKVKFKDEVAAKAQDLKSKLSFEGKDGREYVYLGDWDSYLWLRNARTYLQKGTICDAVIDGECRNTYSYAPVGSRMLYDRQFLHTAAIVGLHRFMTVFNPEVPLSFSAFLVPVVVGVLGVIPAFFIGCRLAGNLGGLFAALLISFQPRFLLRSIGSDNDVWSVVLPLFMMLLAITGMTGKNRVRQVSYGVLAGLVVGLHAAAWRGWFFTYAILLFGLVGNVLMVSVRVVLRERIYKIWRQEEVQRAALVAATFYLSGWFFTTLVGIRESYLAIPMNVLVRVVDISSRTISESVAWPTAFGTVTELIKPGLDGIINSMGGMLFLFGGLFGLLLLLLPRNRWRWYHGSLLLCGVAIDLYIVAAPDLGRTVTVSVLSAPLVAALVLSLFDRTGQPDRDGGAGFVVALWFLGALYVAYDGLRFLELMGPPFGIAAAVTAGRPYERLRHWVAEANLWKRAPAHAVYLAFAGLFLSHPVQMGYAVGGGYSPAMNDAWWDTLAQIRDESSADAIVNTWWDYGYWAGYVAERRVSHDGSSLGSHVPHWIGKALVSPREGESVGLLRMLNCGSDATPNPEGEKGAYGKLVRKLDDPVQAYAAVTRLTNLDDEAARSYLAERGFTDSEQASILSVTHCTPPEAYLIISTDLLSKTGAWMHLGRWDARRAYIAKTARFLPRKQAVSELVARFGYGEREAENLYSEADDLAALGRLGLFVAPGKGYLSEWYPCRVTGAHDAMVCGTGAVSRGDKGAYEFVYDPDSPQDTRVRVQHPSHGSKEIIPAVLLVAGPEKMVEVGFESPTRPDLGVLLDVSSRRILIGTPALLRSTFTHLMLLDGRYATHFEKLAERTAYSGDRIAVWKVNWAREEGER